MRRRPPPQPAPSSNASLLLVDDDQTAIQATDRMLTQYPDRRFATCGDDALRLARERVPDLVLLDVDMPGLSGFDVFDAFRADPRLADVPILFATNHHIASLEMSALDKGAVDFISKPLVAAQLTARIRAQLRARALLAGLRSRYPAIAPDAAHPPAARLLRILIVDDDVATIRIVRSALEGLGDFFFAASGPQALAMAHRIDPDLILIDAQMPEVDGFAVCQALKAESAFRYVPIVFVTRFADPRNEMRALDLGAADFIAKPYAAAVLRARVRKLLAFKCRADAELDAARSHWRRIGDSRATEVLEAAGDAMVSFDASDRVVLFNAAAARLFGVHGDQVLGGPVRAVLPPEVETDTPADGTPTRRTIVGADGAGKPVELRVSFSGEGPDRLTTVVLRNASIGDNAQMLSHLTQAMSTPLRSLLGHAQLMIGDREHALEGDQARRLDHVLDAAQQLCHLRRDALDFAELEARRPTLQASRVNPADCIGKAMASLAALAKRTAVTLSYNCTDDAPFVIADVERLTQCLVNLMGNAIKYNRPGGWVQVRLSRQGDEAVIAVRDNGLGMDAEQCSHLFEPFNRLGREVTLIAGAGLSLVITRNLVEAMNGTLRVETESDKGSCFAIRLPVPPNPAR